MTTVSMFVLFPAAYLGKKYKENTLKILWQKWLSKWEILLRCKYIAYLETQETPHLLSLT